MDISVLRIFVNVVQRGSFASVARDRNVAPSSISRVIAALEDELKIRLFQRSTRQLVLTETGRLYFERINHLVDELEDAGQIATDNSDHPRGTLRVTTPSVFGEMEIIPLLPQLAEKYPLLTIEMILTDVYLDLVKERIDVAIRLGTLRDSSYIARHLRDMSFFVCASPHYLQQHDTLKYPSDVENHNCLLFPRAGYNFNWLFKDKEGVIDEIAIQGKYLITNSRAIKQCTVAGMGLALLPDWLINDDVTSGKLVTLFPGYHVSATDFDSAAWILYPSREYLPLKSRVFIDFLVDVTNT